MNVQEYRQLREALEFQDDVEKALLTLAGHEYIIDEVARVFDAARQTLDRWQECTCDDGCLESGPFCMPCSSCGGSGLLPNQARLEATAEVLFQRFYDARPDESFKDFDDGHIEQTAVAAVRAFDKGEE